LWGKEWSWMRHCLPETELEMMPRGDVRYGPYFARIQWGGAELSISHNLFLYLFEP